VSDLLADRVNQPLQLFHCSPGLSYRYVVEMLVKLPPGFFTLLAYWRGIGSRCQMLTDFLIRSERTPEEFLQNLLRVRRAIDPAAANLLARGELPADDHPKDQPDPDGKRRCEPSRDASAPEGICEMAGETPAPSVRGRYYDGTLYLLAMLHSSGQFRVS